MDVGDQDVMFKLLKDMETFLGTIITNVQLNQAAEDNRKDLLKQIKDCQQYILNLPQEYVDMTHGAQSTEDLFDDSGSQPDEIQQETSSMIEPVEYENGDILFLRENKGDAEENLNLADANPPSASELKAMAPKCGPLQRKDRFMFMDQLRNCWAALYANKLYFYTNERDSKPQNWIRIEGYEARSAPNAIRDSKKKPSCFEIVCPGNKKLQFIASSPNDMEQWLAAINKASGASNPAKDSDPRPISLEPSSGTYEDVDLVCQESLQGSQKEDRVKPASGEDDAIYNDIDSAFNTNNANVQDIYDDTDTRKYTDTTKKYDETIYDDVDELRNIIRNTKY